MPELKCTVQTCMHNKDFYCDLNAITGEENLHGKLQRQAVTALKKEKAAPTVM